ncbi:hypothetical protein RFI_21568 [Reticulomyxa filosa]|uniref:Uncharacterized protein n=1 Tax=Reticulomyxa filosa TaxID=46433 RepID=X6MQ69_RETFI|nr:hypothetical protein RFI_21568 [Reticulomyxa filosa]|eukprot:ETO15796.1 hypothetical protein RFI_21568 [Reticulomyxa filosa]
MQTPIFVSKLLPKLEKKNCRRMDEECVFFSNTANHCGYPDKKKKEALKKQTITLSNHNEELANMYATTFDRLKQSVNENKKLRRKKYKYTYTFVIIFEFYKKNFFFCSQMNGRTENNRHPRNCRNVLRIQNKKIIKGGLYMIHIILTKKKKKKKACGMMLESLQPVWTHVCKKKNFSEKLKQCNERIGLVTAHLRAKAMEKNTKAVGDDCVRSQVYRFRVHADIHRFEFAKNLRLLKKHYVKELEQYKQLVQNLELKFQENRQTFVTDLNEMTHTKSALTSELTKKQQRIEQLQTQLGNANDLNITQQKELTEKINELMQTTQSERLSSEQKHAEQLNIIKKLEQTNDEARTTLQEKNKNLKKFCQRSVKWQIWKKRSLLLKLKCNLRFKPNKKLSKKVKLGVLLIIQKKKKKKSK